MLAVAAALFAMQAQAAQPPLDDILKRVSEEAEAFQQLAPRTVGRETLRHRSRKAAPRFRPRIASPDKPVQVSYLERQVVSEYGYSFLKEAPEAIREFRQVVEVDGRPVLSAGDARTTLAFNMSSDDDRARRSMLAEFERHGMSGAATDFGQMLLLFRRRALGNFDFAIAGENYIGAEAAIVVGWRQKDGPDALRVYHGRDLAQVRMTGELWVRKRDYLPLRVTMKASIQEGPGLTEHAATIDYAPAGASLLLPASIAYVKTLEGTLIVENRYVYSGFKMFRADAEITFTPVDEPPPQ